MHCFQLRLFYPIHDLIKLDPLWELSSREGLKLVWLTSSLIEMITFGLLIYANDGLVRSRVTLHHQGSFGHLFEKIEVSGMF